MQVTIPTLGESITEAVIVRWMKGDGDAVQADEPLLELETEKASVEIPAERAGVLHILKNEGEKVRVGEVVGEIADGASAAKPAAVRKTQEPPKAAPPPAAPAAPEADKAARVSPLARRLAEEHGVDTEALRGSGRGGRVTRADVLEHVGEILPRPERPPAPQAAPETAPRAARASVADGEERVPMTPIRRRIAERLLQAQQSAAILTTFNEIDMSAVMELRRRHKEAFAQAHGVSLGFMSFFARSCVQALREVPALNAEIRDTDIVYKKRVHLGIAVASPRGLVVPVVRDAQGLSFAEIEKEIERLAKRAREGKLSVDELSGGTFSITNGGVFGSLLSTPILNLPQSGILGMHKIEKRPVVIGDEIVARPMMYVALSYDHRLVDGEQAVTFLVRVKERLEDPSRLLLDI